jgi:hypothetical protein
MRIRRRYGLPSALGFNAFATKAAPPPGGPAWSAFAAPYQAPAPQVVVQGPVGAPAQTTYTTPIATPVVWSAQQNVPSSPQMLSAQASQPNYVTAVGTPNNPAPGASQPFANASADSGITAEEDPLTGSAATTAADGWGWQSWFDNLGPHSWLWILGGAVVIYAVAKK